jgi:hypothetical protein
MPIPIPPSFLIPLLTPFIHPVVNPSRPRPAPMLPYQTPYHPVPNHSQVTSDPTHLGQPTPSAGPPSAGPPSTGLPITCPPSAAPPSAGLPNAAHTSLQCTPHSVPPHSTEPTKFHKTFPRPSPLPQAMPCSSHMPPPPSHGPLQPQASTSTQLPALAPAQPGTQPLSSQH